MFAGIAGGLLVFTGLWHATEWMMDGRRRDTWALVPVGLVYLLLGCLLVVSFGGMITQIIALLTVCLGGFTAITRRNELEVRKWVLWAFALIDIAIALCLIIALFS